MTVTQEPLEVETVTVETLGEESTAPNPTGLFARFTAFVRRHPALALVVIAL